MLKLFISVALSVSWMALTLPAMAQSTAPPGTTARPTARQVADRTLPSVVSLSFDTGLADKEIIASGFFVAPDIIATSFHAVNGTRSGYLKVPGNDSKLQIAGIVASDPNRDLVLLKVKGFSGKPLPLGDLKVPSVGDQVYAVGNPEGLEGTFSKGVISGIRREGAITLIQITTPISEGSGGGPILNLNGDVIGVVLGGLGEGENLNFGVPVAFLKTLVANQKPLQRLAPVESAKVQSEPRNNVRDSTAASIRPPRAPGTPGLTSSDVADARSASIAPAKGALTDVRIFTESKAGGGAKNFHFTGDQCGFTIQSSFRQEYDHNGDGLVDYLPLRLECDGGAFVITFGTDRIYQNLLPGVYEKARPPNDGNFSLPGFSIRGPINCDYYNDASFEIHELKVDISNERRPKLISLGVEFQAACRVVGPIRGAIYYNYAP